MDKPFISKRVEFNSKDDQKGFVESVLDYSGLSLSTLAKKLGISIRTLSDWKNGNFRISFLHFKKMLKMRRNKGKINYKVIDLKEHLRSIASKGGNENIKKNIRINNNEEYRLKQWQKWWNKEGKERAKGRFLLDVFLPEKSNLLAEFMGIMIGDGGVAPYHISITLNSEDDKEYAHYVIKLLYNLFRVRAKVYKKKDAKAIDIVIQRKKLVDFCVSLGLKIGNKIRQGIDIPEWILLNDEYTKVCVRGLFDTDGTVYDHKYKSKGKDYEYTKMMFSSASPNLIRVMHKILIKMGFRATIGSLHNSVFLERQDDVIKYYNVIGTSNPKHERKLKKGLERWLSGRKRHRAKVLGT